MIRRRSLLPTWILIVSVTAGAVWLWLCAGPSEAVSGTMAPDITSPVWINSGPVSADSLRGKVVLVEFWTFGCYNCRNVEPQVKDWHHRFSDRGLVVIGIHSPEFSYEKNIDRVRRYVRDHNIRYAVAVDNRYENWNRFRNHYWPALYLIDKTGRIRYSKIGEGGYAQTEDWIEKLLSESP